MRSPADGSDPGSTVITPRHVVALSRSRAQPWGLELGPTVAVANDGFASVNSNAGFAPFSAPNEWALFNSNMTELQIVTPTGQTSTPLPALTRGVGVVFLHAAASGTTIEYFNGQTSLGVATAPVGPTSFVGMLFGDPVVTRVVITLGSTAMFNLNGSPGDTNPGGGRRRRARRARRRADDGGGDGGCARRANSGQLRRRGRDLVRHHRDDRLGRRDARPRRGIAGVGGRLCRRRQPRVRAGRELHRDGDRGRFQRIGADPAGARQRCAPGHRDEPRVLAGAGHGLGRHRVHRRRSGPRRRRRHRADRPRDVQHRDPRGDVRPGERVHARADRGRRRVRVQRPVRPGTAASKAGARRGRVRRRRRARCERRDGDGRRPRRNAARCRR